MIDPASVLEAIATLRETRRFLEAPVPDEALAQVLEAATMASSLNNAQPWRFLVLREPSIRRALGDLIDAVSDELYGKESHSITGERTPLRDVPVLVVVCRRPLPTDAEWPASVPAAPVYAAAQNLVLAARALGLGTRPIVLHRRRDATVRAMLGLPDEVEPCVVVPVGWPETGFGPLFRRPWESVATYDRWSPA